MYIQEYGVRRQSLKGRLEFLQLEVNADIYCQCIVHAYSDLVKPQKQEWLVKVVRAVSHLSG